MNAKAILVILLLAGAGLGAYIFLTQPKQLPDLALKDGSGAEVALSAVMGDRSDLLAVVLHPGCPISKFSLERVLKLHQEYSGQMAFVGLMLQGQKQAEQFAQREGLPFPVFGLKGVSDPYTVQDFMVEVGHSRAGGYMVYGGTVAVIDSDMRLQFRLEQEDLRQLEEKVVAYLE